STAAFNALLKTLEEPPSNVVFVLATTDPQRVLPTIISRCQRFDYRRIPLEPMITHLRHIADQEAIAIDDEALRLVAQVSQGGLRDAQSLLDQLSLLEPPVGAEAVWDLVGAVPERNLLALVQAILSDDSTAVLDQARQLMDRGREPLIVLQNLAGFYRDLLIAKTAGGRQDLVAITPPTWADMQTLVQGIDPMVLLLGQQHLRSAEGQVKNTTQPRLWLEVALLGLLPSTLAGQAAAVPAMGPGAMAPAVAPAVPRPVAPIIPPGQPPQPIAPAPPTSAPVDLAPTEISNGVAPSAPVPSAPVPNTPAPTAPAPLTAPDPPPPPPPDSPPVATDSNLPELWLRVIAVLEPLGTRALMQQQGSLLFYDGVVARVGISSRPLFKMAQGRVDNVEAAFEKVLGQRVQVSLEVLPDPKPEAPAPNISQADGRGQAASPGVETPAMPSMAAAPAPATGQGGPVPPPSAAMPSVGSPVTPSVTPSAPPSGTPAGMPATLPPGNPPLPGMVSDLDRAVKNFAQFFNGQIVDLDSDLGAEGTTGPPQPSEAAAKQPSHADKDVPF
ncbi:MAG TPA: DNA polymerase III subunit gamma/tau, partial [Nodosilinea sp.]|nr:DNA polymerase III subunit gamma/tau [Nodosilinea sp.]